MNPLNQSQVHILHALNSSPGGMSRSAMAQSTPPGTSLGADNLGPVTDDPLDRGSNPTSLRARGLVSVQQFEDEPAVYSITSEGRKWAKRSAARTKLPDDQRIPGDILDTAVKQVRQNKSYGLELFTDADVDEVRSICCTLELDAQQNSSDGCSNGDADAVIERYANIEPDNIRLQMTNRRKMGAYSDPNVKKRAALVKLGTLLRDFGFQLDGDSEEAYIELCDAHDIDLPDTE